MSIKKIVCVIDSLNSGGAQRQMIALTNFFISKGIEVHLVVIHPIYTIENLLLRSDKLVIHRFQKYRYFSAFSLLVKLSMLNEYNFFLSYLKGPNFLLLSLKLLFPKIFIVVSERRGFSKNLGFFWSLQYYFYFIANVVVFNSTDTYKKVVKYCIPLKFNSKVIYNLTKHNSDVNKLMNQTRISFIANYRIEKNYTLLLNTIVKFKNVNTDIFVNCYGNNFFINNIPSKYSKHFLSLKNRVIIEKLSKFINLNSYVEDPTKIYSNSEFILLLSDYEGFPNVVCEGMMNGCIIISTAVSDVEKFIIHKVNGFILQDSSPEALFEAFKWAKSLNIEDKLSASQTNKKIAQIYFYSENVGIDYLHLFAK